MPPMSFCKYYFREFPFYSIHETYSLQKDALWYVLLTSFHLDELTKSLVIIHSSNFIDTMYMYPSIGENKSSLNLSTVFCYSIKFKCCQQLWYHVGTKLIAKM